MTRFPMLLSAAAVLVATPALARPAENAEATMRALYGSRAFNVARQSLAADYDRIVSEITTLTEIPAPPFKVA